MSRYLVYLFEFTSKYLSVGYAFFYRAHTHEQLHEHATYLVDSLWDVASNILKDFESMSDMLLEEGRYETDRFDEKQESALVDIMVCAVKQAAEGVPPSGRQGYHKVIIFVLI